MHRHLPKPKALILKTDLIGTLFALYAVLAIEAQIREQRRWLNVPATQR